MSGMDIDSEDIHPDPVFTPKIASRLQGVIISTNSTFNISVLTSEGSKALIPINNKPLIWHSFKLLVDSGVTDIYIIIEPEFTEAVVNVFIDNFSKITPKIVPLERKVSGSLEVLMCIKHYIKSDFIVIPCDLYGNVDIAGLIKSHFETGSSCTLLLYTNLNDSISPYQCMSVLDESSNSLISLVDMLSFKAGNSLDILKWHVFTHPNCTIRSDLIDLHAYIFKFDLFPFQSYNCYSIRFHYIPLLLKYQDMPASTEAYLDAQRASNGGFAEGYPGESSPLLHKNYTMGYHIQNAGRKDDCLRVNTPEAFVYLSLKQNITRKTDNLTIKMSNIAEDVIFRERATVTKSVIMSGAIIGDNVTLKDCLVCSNAVIGDNCQLSDCVVGYSFRLHANTRASRQTYPQSDFSI